MEIRQAVVFAILMENNNGILGKAPSYITEKLDSASMMESPEQLLDSSNLAKFKRWTKIWGGYE